MRMSLRLWEFSKLPQINLHISSIIEDAYEICLLFLLNGSKAREFFFAMHNLDKNGSLLTLWHEKMGHKRELMMIFLEDLLLNIYVLFIWIL